MRIIKKIIKLYKKIITKIKNDIFTEFYLYKIELENINFKKNNFILKKISFTELELLNKINEIDKKRIEILKDRSFNYEEMLNYVVVESDEILGYFSLLLKSNENNPYVSSKLRIPKESTYLFDDYTVKKHRKKGVHSFSVLSRLKISKDLNYKEARVLIDKRNYFSQKTYESLGFIKIYKIYRIRLKFIKDMYYYKELL